MGDLVSLTAVFIMLFFLGLTILRTGLYQLSYEKMTYLLTNFTQNIYLAVITGTIATAILQSSSLIMVLTVSFVSIGFITFRQSIGIIFGANIGTTVTGELMAFSNIIPETSFVIIGAILLFINNRAIFSIGAILVGLGTIFVALDGFESLAPLITNMPILSESLLHTNNTPSFGVIIGTLVSGTIQSSSATIGITMSILNEGLITLPVSIAIVLGANIGTCITALLAIIGTKKEAKLVAMGHFWFNIISVLMFIPFLGWLSDLAQLLASDVKEQLAHISLLFNIFSVLIFLPFVNLFEKFIYKLHRKAV
ncbi:Na/Pi symporter [Aquibacillus koreensis]|uniref:Na/Pi symporter n=1 Tax=Aquibacillus koreensis TaxID=279446 RepID=A0A9X3WHG0_9BACI|nr:Na/Pi symporter [Aquibacillus koreensis]MCT2537607.1 Na/Pi symporter [Aquibacillus koreensis]MDC3419053.1 Na/Pi symporter [Aquibacillus koreensis]